MGERFKKREQEIKESLGKTKQKMGEKMTKIGKKIESGITGIGKKIGEAREEQQKKDEARHEAWKASLKETKKKVGEKMTKFGEGVKASIEGIGRKKEKEALPAEKARPVEGKTTLDKAKLRRLIKIRKEPTETKGIEEEIRSFERQKEATLGALAETPKTAAETPKAAERGPKIEFAEGDIRNIKRYVQMKERQRAGEMINSAEMAGMKTDIDALQDEKVFERIGLGNDYNHEFVKNWEDRFEKIVRKFPEKMDEAQRKYYDNAVRQTARDAAEKIKADKLSDAEGAKKYREEFDRVSEAVSDLMLEEKNKLAGGPEKLPVKTEPPAEGPKVVEQARPKTKVSEEMIKAKEEKIKERRAEAPGAANEVINKARETLNKASALLTSLEGGEPSKKEVKKTKGTEPEKYQGVRKMEEMLDVYPWGKKEGETREALEEKDRTIGALRQQMQELIGAVNLLVTAMEAMQRQPGRAEVPPREQRPQAVPPREAPPARAVPGEIPLRGELLRLRPEIRRERPWDRELVSEVGINFGKEKGAVIKNIEAQIKSREIEYAKEWFDDHGDEIENAGYDYDNKDAKYMRMVTEKLGGFEGLTGRDADYNHLLASRYVLMKGSKVPIDRAQIILHQLGERRQGIEAEMNEAEGLRNKPLAKVKEAELKKLHSLRKGLAEKISDRNFREEVRGEKGRIGWMFKRESAVTEAIEEKIKEVDTYESALDAANARYDGARKKAEEELMVDVLGGRLKGRPETRRVFEAMEREFEGQGREPQREARELVRAMYTRQEREGGLLSDMEGDYGADRERILGFFEDSGIRLDPDAVDFAKVKLEAKRKTYEKAFEGDMSLVNYLMELIFESLTKEAREAAGIMRERRAERRQ